MTVEEKAKHAAYQRAWRAKHPEKSRAISRRHYYRHLEKNRERVRWNMTRILHGIRREDFAKMLERQGGVCAICHKKQEGGNVNQNRLHIDHDHATGQIRDLLCSKCNLLIGYCDENPVILEAAIGYLRKWK